MGQSNFSGPVNSIGGFQVGGVPVAGNGPRQAAEANIATADATDLPTALVLANATKAKVNNILVKLRAAGIIAP